MENRRRRRCGEACTTCKRRKEKCDGIKPCARCTERGVEAACAFAPRENRSDAGHEQRDKYQHPEHIIDNSPVSSASRITHSENDHFSLTSSSGSSTSLSNTSRLIMDATGKYMFIGDSANLSMLQQIRNLVRASIGACAFVEDPLRYQMVESVPTGSATWLHATEKQPPSKPSLHEATYLIRWFSFATNCVLDLFDEKHLLDNLPNWLESLRDDGHMLSALYYLIFAIGAQACPDEKDVVASQYFDHGRYLTASYFTEDPSITTVQAYAMITMYMLCASRRNAAFMYLGTAVRAAYALGLHRSDISGHFGKVENQTRERLWKVMRILDLFMSASLGRPPSTAETRNTELKENYSASNDLCFIFEKILTDIYAKRMVSTDTLEQISWHHRRWTSRFREGLATDRIEDRDLIDGQRPNIGLLHVKEAYYWTVILLARPFFVETISQYIATQRQSRRDGQEGPDRSKSSHHILVHACVNSAMCTIDLLQILLTAPDIPKRLPFVVNSLFVAGLVLGLSYFGDWYTTYPLGESLDTALKLLALFPSDAIAMRNSTILELLRDACRVYVCEQALRNKHRQKHLVGGMFGHMENCRLAEGKKGNSSLSGTAQSSEMHRSSLSQSADDPGRMHSPRSQEDTISHDSGLGMDTFSDRIFDVFNTSDTGLSPGNNRDLFLAPMMSPRTLWFDSYENNNPLFSTIDVGRFID